MFCPIEGKRSEKGMKVPDEIQDCLKASDPLFSTHKASYMENCQRCVMAYELRRRGYSVVAQPYIPDGADMLPYMDRRYGWPAVFEKQIITDCSAVTQAQAKENIERQMRAYGDGSRAIVRVNWLSRATDICSWWKTSREGYTSSTRKRAATTSHGIFDTWLQGTSSSCGQTA